MSAPPFDGVLFRATARAGVAVLVLHAADGQRRDGWAQHFADVGFDARALSHADLEDDLDRRGRDLLRRLLQDHLDLRAQREGRVEVVLTAPSTAAPRPATPAS